MENALESLHKRLQNARKEGKEEIETILYEIYKISLKSNEILKENILIPSLLVIEEFIEREKQLLKVGDIITDFEARIKDVEEYYTNKELSNIQIVTAVFRDDFTSEYMYHLHPLNDVIVLGKPNNSYKYYIFRRRKENKYVI